VIFLNIEVKNKTENILLSRIEVQGNISFDKGPTPSEEDVKKELSKVLEVEKDLIIIKGIYTGYGENTAELTAYQYLSKDDLKNIEPKDKKKKAENKEGEKKEAPAEEKKEAPAEEKKEAPAEEKKEAPTEEKKKEPKAEEAPKEEPKKE
jgi:ribosomal protein S24E